MALRGWQGAGAPVSRYGSRGQRPLPPIESKLSMQVRGWTSTQAGLVVAATFRSWPGWRGACPRQPLAPDI